MANYADLTEITALHQQAQQIQLAIDNLDADGPVTAVTVSPPPPKNDDPTTAMGPMMASTVWLTGTTKELAAEVRAALTQQQQELFGKLGQLGVTQAPALR